MKEGERKRDEIQEGRVSRANTRLDCYLQNGGYIQPPPIKRQFRDPHGEWWDKQERRNYGEACHEDYDQLGMFTPYEYTWVSSRKGLMQIGVFLAALATVLYAVKLTYPDIPAYPREFEAGLDRELGGAGAIRVSAGSHCIAVIIDSYS